MPDLATFARRIRRRAQQVETEVGKVVTETAILIDQTVVLATPVEFGGARANWLPSIGIPITEPTEDLDPSGQATIAKGAAIIQSRAPGETVFISNNIHYIGLLNDGSSSQAPANFVQIAINTAIAFLRRRKILV